MFGIQHIFISPNIGFIKRVPGDQLCKKMSEISRESSAQCSRGTRGGDVHKRRGPLVSGGADVRGQPPIKGLPPYF